VSDTVLGRTAERAQGLLRRVRRFSRLRAGQTHHLSIKDTTHFLNLLTGKSNRGLNFWDVKLEKAMGRRGNVQEEWLEDGPKVINSVHMAHLYSVNLIIHSEVVLGDSGGVACCAARLWSQVVPAS